MGVQRVQFARDHYCRLNKLLREAALRVRNVTSDRCDNLRGPRCSDRNLAKADNTQSTKSIVAALQA